MKRLACLLCPALVLLLAAESQAITIPTVPVGNAGNAGQVHSQGTFGAVAYDYRIGTTEVTNAQYAAFLNAKAASDPLSLYNTNMDSEPRGGITRSGASGSYTYTLKANMGDKPVTFVSWYDAIRFANWLHNGQGGSDTEAGAYTLLGGTPTPSNGLSITRNSGAVWFLTSEDEWYKAALYDPTLAGGGGYWAWPTRSNTAPTKATANSVGDISNPGINVANFGFGAIWNDFANVTTVGSAGPLSESYYGTSDQAGNVAEWNEALINGSFRGQRGGDWSSFTAGHLLPNQGISLPGVERAEVGFRVATVPEPSTMALAALGIAGLFIARRRRHAAGAAAALIIFSLLGGTNLYAITIPTVPVGNPGNAGVFYPTQGTLGSVGYSYRIGTYEVTNSQYAEFLNAKAASDPLGLYNPTMGNGGLFGGIARSGISGSYTYSLLPNMGNKPVLWVSWYDAVRFINWINNGQGNADTETGSYTLLGGTPTPSNWSTITRNPGATWVLPTQDEWYKAAFYDPAISGGTGGYWTYATRSNTVPTPATANSVGDISNPGPNVVNYMNGAFWNGQPSVTTVGSAGLTSRSAYGTSDQAGNAWEWNETQYLPYRGRRGAGFRNSALTLQAGVQANVLPDNEIEGGFRVAMIPEPSTFALAALGVVGLFIVRRRCRARRAAGVLITFAMLGGTNLYAVTIPTVPIGNAGNAPDRLWGSNNPTSLRFGAVAYDYRIGTTEVTNAQYVEFLNAVAKTDTFGLYNTNMGASTWGGITRSGSGTIPDPYVYSVKADAVNQGPGGTDYTYASKPVNYVNWGDAARFSNWLHNGQPSGPQNAGTTEDGTYTLNGATTRAALNAIVRNAGATWFIPSEDEWYKAAYYDGDTSTYYRFPTGSNVTPNQNLPSMDTGNSANFYFVYTTGNGLYPLTDAGAYTLSASPYGTYDQGGNIYEWNEAVIVHELSGTLISVRGLRGGSFNGFVGVLDAASRNNNDTTAGDPTVENFLHGFRVATVPEPSTLVLAALGMLGLSFALQRRRHVSR